MVEMKTLRCLFALILALCALPSAAFTINGKVVSVADGDTLTLLDVSRRQHRIRLARIDAPEVGHGRREPAQAFGERSKASLAELAFGREARADCGAADPYQRSVCRVTVGGVDVSVEQVRPGMAWVYRQHARNAPAYYEAENEARQARRGLWTERNPVPPWEWRTRWKRR
jgi:endonuclease YncB( thermonuclease family)